MPQNSIQLAEQAIQNKQFDSAIQHYDQAEKLGAQPKLMLKGLSFAKYGLGKANAAIKDLQTYIQLVPDDGEAWRNLAVMQINQKQPDAALAALHKAIGFGKGDEFSWNKLIELHYQKQQFGLALSNLLLAKAAIPTSQALLKKELAIQSAIDTLQFPSALDDNILLQLIKLANEWIQSNPSAAILLAFKTLQSAISGSEQALPELIKLFAFFARHYPHLNLSTYGYAFALHLSKQYEQSAEWYYAALPHNPQNDQLYLNMGMVLRQLNRHDQAITALEKSQSLGCKSAKLHENLGIVYTGTGRLKDALHHYKLAAQQMPNEAKVRFSYGIVLLLDGQFELGWQEYQHRANALNLKHKPDNTTRWTGQNLADKHLIVIHEQGLGDTINFVRYIPYLAQQAKKLTLKVQQPLVEQIKQLKGLANNSQVISTDDPVSTADYFCTLMDLPGLFNANLSNIPQHTPYLTPIASKVEFWQQQLSNIEGKKVGLVWGGNPSHARDKERSLSLAQFAPLFTQQNVQFISLQMGEPLKQISQFQHGEILDYSSHLNDFSDTAALISQLDLVISIDTSVAHMAGALNIPTWLLVNYVPDWRWLMTSRSTIWYPSVRLFREQQLQNWQPTLNQLNVEFSHWLQDKQWLDNQYLFDGIKQNQLSEVSITAVNRLQNNGQDIEALRALAIIATKQEQIDYALSNLQKLLAISPFDLDAHMRIGQLYQNQQQFDQALEHYLTALPLQSNNNNLYILTGQCFHRTHRQHEAIAMFNKVLASDPNNADALSELGSSYKQIGQHQQALQVWQHAQKLAPNKQQNTVRLGMQQLLMGQFTQGWQNFNVRWQTDKYSKDHIYRQYPVWQGQKVDTLLVYDEQGLGDTIQFLRYIWPAAQRVNKLKLLIKDKLHCLLEHDLAQLPTNVELIAGMTFTGTMDAHCPLMALQIALSMQSDGLHQQVPYLHVANTYQQKWQQRIPQSDLLKVGLVWAGNPEHLKDQYRSIELQALSELCEIENGKGENSEGKKIAWYSLQMGEGLKQIDDCQFAIKRLDDQIENFADTSAILQQLDLLITVDTSVAHLAGALNVPCWLMLSADPDWRWLLNTDKSYWYPNTRLFRQHTIYQWSDVIQDIKLALTQLIQNNRN
ncbi:hypothetical protein C2869_12350 [Saccharobesus litoralis]|uniref:Tfp pilus assembly protein PilF n=1 Tax=Saccharobesus litoralis TaxID=2172099 RepID=A0A2S0VSK0_9ALTE|nr:tetratricopeptide repeat protein [Saccharobesus litoralis]AWB67177.1 hypothetical protein C2869_12350 [Saccharobesus litoralis]